MSTLFHVKSLQLFIIIYFQYTTRSYLIALQQFFECLAHILAATFLLFWPHIHFFLSQCLCLVLILFFLSFSFVCHFYFDIHFTHICTLFMPPCSCLTQQNSSFLLLSGLSFCRLVQIYFGSVQKEILTTTTTTTRIIKKNLYVNVLQFFMYFI